LWSHASKKYQINFNTLFLFFYQLNLDKNISDLFTPVLGASKVRIGSFSNAFNEPIFDFC